MKCSILRGPTPMWIPAALDLCLIASTAAYDREVTASAGDGRFWRVEVVGGNLLPGNPQEIVSGVKPGERVVASALVLQQTLEEK